MAISEKHASRLKTWVVTDGKVGIVNQAVGLAEAIGFPYEEKVIELAAPWRWLPAQFWPKGTLGLHSAGDTLSPPWPDIVVSCGRQSLGPARAVKSRSGNRVYHAHIQHPRMAISSFDLLVVPAHDDLSGPNVLSTQGAIHRVTKEQLNAAALKFAPMFAQLPRPLTAVLVGGNSKVHQLTAPLAHDIADRLLDFVNQTGGSLLVTPSRRTGRDNEEILRNRLRDAPSFIWDGGGENPYFGMLALADHIVVTDDSVNMVSEACFTGKPVFVVKLDGGSRKFQAFHKDFEDAGFTRPFTGTLSHWTYEPLNETARAAAFVRAAFGVAA